MKNRHQNGKGKDKFAEVPDPCEEDRPADPDIGGAEGAMPNPMEGRLRLIRALLKSGIAWAELKKEQNQEDQTFICTFLHIPRSHNSVVGICGHTHFPRVRMALFSQKRSEMSKKQFMKGKREHEDKKETLPVIKTTRTVPRRVSKRMESQPRQEYYYQASAMLGSSHGEPR
ncbi:hypothetical protein BLNAU_21672 [Blattamonas nauphoetae]|uniref:Uncharacterized protein n=1 Tax=Blattamonas nauphoetae TaxID=2049346 RepID=A0ABQ9WVA5_9EUKA|nr:hypothetical protein BLNAU_21672 [Blattamonas nauphoetae]